MINSLIYLLSRFEMSINTDISILRFYEYIENISKIMMDILKKNIDRAKIIKNSLKCLENLLKK